MIKYYLKEVIDLSATKRITALFAATLQAAMGMFRFRRENVVMKHPHLADLSPRHTGLFVMLPMRSAIDAKELPRIRRIEQF